MSIPRLLTVSLAANALLAAVLVFWPRTTPGPTTVARRPPRRVAPAPPPAPPAPEVVLRTSVRPFRWEQVVSSDFFVYRNNLRAVGCPDRTMRDILLSEVNRTYAARADALIRPIASRFWDVLAEMVHDEKAMEGKYRMIERGIEELDHEHERVLEELLGKNRGQPSPPAYDFDDQERQAVGFLSIEKQEQFAALKLDFAERWQARVQQAQEDQRPIPPEEYPALEAERNAALEALMTPEEWFEYRLRISSHSGLRHLASTGLTDDELRQVAALRLQADLQHRIGESSPAGDAQAHLRHRYGIAPDLGHAPASNGSDLEDAVRAYLGEERYAQFQRSKDHHYQQLATLGERTDVNTETIDAVHDIHRIARQESERLKSRQDLTPEQRAEAIEAIQSETVATLRRIWPSDQFENYTRVAGPWWTELGR